MSRKEDLEKLIIEHTRRLQKREEQQARYGIATEPHVLVEIEDIKAKLAELQEELAALEEISRLNPYRGLFAFREEDEPFFFGREIFTAQLVAVVQQKPLVTILGPSGSGKSSIVFAGLVPNLTRSGQWCLTSFRPGKDPFLGLAGALVPLYETNLNRTEQLGARRKLSVGLYKGAYPLSDVLNLIHQVHPNRRLLIIADQFEEIYTLCRDSDMRKQFLNMLLQTVGTASEASFGLMLTMRADFLGQALLYPPLGDALQGTIELLRPMSLDELRRAIKEPAAKQEVSFEPGLIERILDDVRNEPGNLPLLEFALTTLWERQVKGELTHAAYEVVKGVEGALSEYADAVFTGLGEAEQRQAQRIFVQLVRPGEDTADTRRLAYLYELGETDWQLVQQLADERLVVTDWNPAGQETVEIAHEALIRGWARLKTWMKQNRDFRVWQERLRNALYEWHDSGPDEDILLRGKPLADAEYWLAERESDLSRAERNFIRASVTLREQQAAAQTKIKRQAQRLLWFAWVLACTVGWTMGWLMVFALGGAARGVMGGAVVGAFVGTMQWLVLRRQALQAGWWIPATIVGWSLAFITVFALGGAIGENRVLAVVGSVGEAIGGATSGIMAGTAVGIMQWLVMRQKVSESFWWILVSLFSGALVFALGEATGAAVSRTVVFALGGTVGEAVVLAVGGAIGGVTSGAITGITLVWLLQRPMPKS